MNYAVRAIDPTDPTPYRANRWVIHRAGRPHDIAGYAFTKRGALRQARRWQRQHDRASVSHLA